MQPAQVAPGIESDEELQNLYNWVDETPLSRPKRNISRDFADGVLFAEIVNNFFPRLIEMHNYSAANSHTQKMYNWTTLNNKVLKKLGYQIHQQDLEDIIKAAPGAIERVLKVLQEHIARAQAKDRGRPSVAGVPPPAAAPARQSTPSGGGRALSSGDGRLPGGEPSLAAQPTVQKYQREVDTELLVEKEQTIAELREMVVIMSEKIKKLEQLVRIKDTKIEALTQKCQKHGLV
mmetsp:Transcript_77932/g.167236  ORF Transcript_77932/g.167236 Transcript_77932/m.167236 type:complete len:234 (+) Transcript_77932:82-783(+)